jgi:hypothetical protein
VGLLEIIIIGLIVIAIYLLVRWVLGILKVAVPNDLLVIGAIILFILAVSGKVRLGL